MFFFLTFWVWTKFFFKLNFHQSKFFRLTKISILPKYHFTTFIFSFPSIITWISSLHYFGWIIEWLTTQQTTQLIFHSVLNYWKKYGHQTCIWWNRNLVTIMIYRSPMSWSTCSEMGQLALISGIIFIEFIKIHLNTR